MASLQLDASGDLMLDASGNVAVAPTALGLAQDAASAIKLFLGEYIFDTTLGVPWLEQVLALSPPLALLKQLLVDAALSVNETAPAPAIASAQVFISEFSTSTRTVTGQVQIVQAASGVVEAADFSVVIPQGGG